MDEYVISSATLLMRHAYPPSCRETVALVDISLVLGSVTDTGSLLDAGAWINVIGYVGEPAALPGKSLSAREICVRALVLWSAGNIDLDEYRRGVCAAKGGAGVGTAQDGT